jgi:hypothetical protein
MNTESRIARRRLRLLLGSAVALVLAASLATTAVAKGDDLPVNARIIGAAGARTIDFVTAVDPTGATIFSDEVADIEPMAPALVFGPGPAGRPAPGLTTYYEIDFAQPLAADRFPWNGMSTPHFYFYPGRRGISAYVRLHMTRGSQPPVDGWIPAQLEFANWVTPYLERLAPFQTASRPPASPSEWWWLGAVLLVAGATVLLLRQLGLPCAGRQVRSGGYFMPLVAAPPTKYFWPAT